MLSLNSPIFCCCFYCLFCFFLISLDLKVFLLFRLCQRVMYKCIVVFVLKNVMRVLHLNLLSCICDTIQSMRSLKESYLVLFCKFLPLQRSKGQKLLRMTDKYALARKRFHVILVAWKIYMYKKHRLAIWNSELQCEINGQSTMKRSSVTDTSWLRTKPNLGFPESLWDSGLIGKYFNIVTLLVFL